MDAILIGTKDAAHLLGIGKTTLFKLMKEGQLDVRKSGRKTLCTFDSIRAYANRAVDTGRP